MRKILLLVFVLVSFSAIGQVVQFPTNYGVGYRRTGADTLLWIPTDTFAVPAPLASRTHVARKASNLYYWNGNKWAALSGGGSTDTTSLSNRINLKLNISDTASMLTNYINGVGYALLKTGQTVRADSATLANYFLRRKDSATGTNLNGYLTRSNVQNYAPLFGVGDSRATANRSFSLAGKEFLIDSVGTQFRYFGYNDPLFGWYGYNSSGQATSLLENTGAGFTVQNWDRATSESAELSMLPTRYNISIFHSTGNFYLHNSKESNWMDQIIQNEWTGTGGSTPKFGEFRNVTGANTSGNFFTSMSNNISTYLYNRIILDSTNRISLGTKNSSGATYKGIKIDGSHQVFVDSMATGGASADSVVVITSGGQLKKRNTADFGGSQTWQQTLTAGSTLTGANTIAGGAYNFTFGNMGLFTISQTAKASVSGSNGTAHVSPLTVTGGNGGSTSYSTGTVSGGNAGNVSVTAGNGGAITGTPTTGIGGSGGYIDLIGGDGGLGTTFGGAAGFVNIQGGTSGGGTSAGSAGYVSIKGGMAASTGNGNGGDIYLSPGAKNGSGADGHIFLGLSPSLAVRGAATIGSATKGDSLFNIKDGGLYADRGVRFPNIPSGTKDDSLVVKNSTGIIKFINTGDFTRQQDTISLASFGGGGGQAGDTTTFSTSTIYGSFYNDGSDTLVITSIRAVLKGSSPSLVPTVYYNDSINVTAGATKLVNSPSALTNTATGVSSTPDNSKIPPGVWVWVSTATVTTKPTYFSLTLIGYKKRK